MNLVQINERLKDLPMQVLQQYANGMNPEVPPYLALGELQRREMSQKQMATAQGGMQGPQPSIKEQVEQKAGLMALQQMQQQQVAQQMQQPRGPMPAPAGVPQPEPQPEVMMARGGLAGIPVRRDMFEYAGGGIIAFSGETGSQVKKPLDAEAKETLEEAQRSGDRSAMMGTLKKLAAAGYDIATLIPRAAMGVAEDLSNTRLGRALGVDFEMPQAAYGGDRASMTPMMDRVQKAEAQARVPTPPTQAPYSNEGRQPPVGLPEALKNIAPPPPSAGKPPVTPIPAPGGLLDAAKASAPKAAAPNVSAQAPQGNVSPFMAEAAAAAREKPVAPTPEGIIAEQKKLLPAGMQEEAMQKMFADQRARAEGRQAAYEKSKPSGLDDLIRVFGQSAQYKGGTGIAPAYTSLQQQRRSEDLAMQKQQDELMTAIEGRQYGADKEMFGARKEAMSAAQKSFQDRLMTNTKTLADLAGVDQRRMDEAAQRLNQMQVAKLQAATAARPSEAERIEAKYMGMLAKGQTKEAEDYLNTISKIKGGGAAGVGAGRNAIMERRQEMKELESMAKNESGQFSEEDAKWAASRISQLARENAKEGGGAPAGAPLPPNASPKNLVVGTVYQTAKGPAKWTGTGFMPI